MKYTIPFALFSFTLLTGCMQSLHESPYLKKEYFRSSGTPLAPQQWQQDGQEKIYFKTGSITTNPWSHGVLEGEVTQTFPHSTTLAVKEKYEQGILCRRIQYHPCGLPIQQEIFENEKRIKTTWYATGAPQSHEIYQADLLLEGHYLSPAQEQESCVQEKKGTTTERDFDGTLLSRCSIQEGEIALRTLYDLKGNLIEKIPYSHGKIEGEREYFHPQGQPKAREQWQKGVQEGTTKLYQQGVLYATIPYHKGLKEGVEQRVQHDGTLIEEISWQRGQRHGVSNLYFAQQRHQQWYYRDKKVTKRQFDLLTQPQ